MDEFEAEFADELEALQELDIIGFSYTYYRSSLKTSSSNDVFVKVMRSLIVFYNLSFM